MESVEPEDDVHDGDKAEGAAVVPEEDEERTLQGTETVESTQEDFQEHSIPQTSPRDQPMIPEEVPESPAPLHEEPPVVVAEESQPVAEPEEVEAVPEVTEAIEETEQEETDQEVPVETVEESSTVEEQAAPVPLLESNQQNAEVSASSSFSEALCVEEESAEQVAAAEPAKLDESKEQQYESVEFLEMSGASAGATEQTVVQPLPVEHTNGLEEESKNRITTPELEDELDNTEAPPMDDLDDEREDELLEDVQEPQEATFSERDRDNESIIVIPDTPKPPKSQEFDEEFELMDKSPVSQSSYATVGRVELHHSPVMKQEVPTTPRTPDSKPSKSSCSPDKPDDQEQADVPEAEVIDITDSPITVLEPKLHHLTDGKPGSTTSTPLGMGSKMTAKDRLIQNSRKRSLSASDAEIVKKNVTFHSPANCTMLVDTIDERLKKKNESATKIPHGHRKRSHSEHKDVAGAAAAAQDGPKPSKISKLPNFKNIHQQQFNRMESIEPPPRMARNRRRSANCPTSRTSTSSSSTGWSRSKSSTTGRSSGPRRFWPPAQ
ncbi:hypothetical protein RP20_CCG001345 [Aedes albopictus]|nr:hypothetical protein RP20_CCG001345 [Aedes albopictus]